MQHRKTPSRITALHEHVTAFVIAWLVIVGVAGTLMFREGLLADVTAAQSAAQNASVQLPIVYSLQGGKLQVKTSTAFTDVTSMTFFVVFDPKTVVLDLTHAESAHEFTFAPGMDTMVQVTVMVKWDLSAWEVLFALPMSGSTENVTIANAGVLRDDTIFETIAIQKD